MRKLLSANCHALCKNKLFWIELICCALFAGWIMLINYSPKIQSSADALHLEDSFFTMYQSLCIILAAAISLITGTEYTDGTIRNKLIVGHSRADIYFSILLTNLGACLAAIAVHGICSFGVGFFLFGAFTLPAGQVAVAILCAALANLVFTALFAAVALNCSNRSVTAVVSLLLTLFILFAASYVGNRLSEPEMTYDSLVITENGFQYGDLIQNPNYVSGFTRSVFAFLYDLLPAGQLIQIYSLELAHWPQWIVMSVLLFAAITAIGFSLFRKKDIR